MAREWDTETPRGPGVGGLSDAATRRVSRCNTGSIRTLERRAVYGPCTIHGKAFVSGSIVTGSRADRSTVRVYQYAVTYK